MKLPVLSSTFAVLALASLTSCYSPVPKLPPGTSVQFHNAISNEVTFQRVGFTVFGNERKTFELPELAPMMRRVVMEEAAKAGLNCTYTTGQIPMKERGAAASFIWGGAGYDLDSAIQNAKKPVGFIAVSSYNSNPNRPTYLATKGFAVEETKVALFPARPALAGCTAVLRYDKNATEKTKARMSRFAGNFPLVFLSYEDKRVWSTALPSSKAKALKVWELQFRTAVAMIMGNPEPRLDPPLSLKRL